MKGGKDEMKEKLDDAFLFTYHRHKDMVYRIAYTYVKNEEDAKDILQEVFLKFYNSKKMRFAGEEHQKHWLIRVTINRAKDYVTSAWFSRRSEISSEDIVSPLCHENMTIIDEVRSLPVKYKAVIYLHYYEDYTYEEIAEILKLRLSAVKMRAKRGREMLKLELLDDVQKGEGYEAIRIKESI